ncbi:39S ribosomal protein L54, mitochondrial [Glycine soja]
MELNHTPLRSFEFRGSTHHSIQATAAETTVRRRSFSTVSSKCKVFASPKNVMAMNRARYIRHILTTKEVVGVACQRTFATGKAKKGSKGGAAADAPKASTLSKEVKSSTVVGANILKEGTDPKIQPDSEYPDWLWHLLDKRPALSELRRRNIDTLSYEDLKRFVKLDTRARIKENNSVKAKN